MTCGPWHGHVPGRLPQRRRRLGKEMSVSRENLSDGDRASFNSNLMSTARHKHTTCSKVS